ncbi:hypothetical protein Tco_1200586 [Tanacetum coccineum]
MPPKDDVLPAEEQPLPTAVLPTTNSPGYILESDLEEDLEEDDDEDPEEDPADYPTDRDDDDDEEEPYGGEADDEDEDDEEEEEHLTPANPTTVAFLAVDHVPSVEETEPFETDESTATPPPHPAYHVTARISIRAQTSVSLPSDTELAKILAIPTPPPSPLSPWSSPLPQIPSPPLPPILSPLPVSPPLPVSSPPLPASPTYPLGYRAAIIQLRAESPSTSHPLTLPPPIVLPHTRASVAVMRVAAPSTYILAPQLGILPSKILPLGTPPLLPIPLPNPSPPLLLPSTDYRVGVSEARLSPRKRLCIALGLRYEVGESSSAPTARPIGGCRVDYGFVGTLDDEIRLLMSGRLNTLFRDKRAHAHTALLMEREARISREAWGWSMDASDTTRSKVRALRTTILAQQTEIAALRAC